MVDTNEQDSRAKLSCYSSAFIFRYFNKSLELATGEFIVPIKVKLTTRGFSEGNVNRQQPLRHRGDSLSGNGFPSDLIMRLLPSRGSWNKV